MKERISQRTGVRGREGFSLMEVLVAAFLLIVVFFGLAQIYTRGRIQMGYEEDRRKATAVLQARLDDLRRSRSFDELQLLVDTNNVADLDTTYTSDSREYDVTHALTLGPEIDYDLTVDLTVTWYPRVGNREAERTMTATTILSRAFIPAAVP